MTELTINPDQYPQATEARQPFNPGEYYIPSAMPVASEATPLPAGSDSPEIRQAVEDAYDAQPPKSQERFEFVHPADPTRTFEIKQAAERAAELASAPTTAIDEGLAEQSRERDDAAAHTVEGQRSPELSFQWITWYTTMLMRARQAEQEPDVTNRNMN